MAKWFIGLLRVSSSIGLMLLLTTSTAPLPIAVKPSTQTYMVFIPYLEKPPGLWGGGVASTTGGQFNNALRADFWYKWSWCDVPNCIPMLRNWTLPPSCPLTLLLGNEPNAPEPFGYPITPEDAATISQQIRALCPGTWLVAGNVAMSSEGEFLSAVEWIWQYLDADGIANQVGVHCYVPRTGSAQQCVDWLNGFMDAFPQRMFCLTEWNTFNRDPVIFQELLNFVVDNFGCYAIFTDFDKTWQWYSINLDLINPDGTPNVYGEIYRSRSLQ